MVGAIKKRIIVLLQYKVLMQLVVGRPLWMGTLLPEQWAALITNSKHEAYPYHVHFR